MTDSPTTSRRSLLTAAAASAAAVAASQLARPLPVAAADPNDLVLGQDNPTLTLTSITQGTADANGLGVSTVGTGTAVAAAAAAGIGVSGTTTGTKLAGVVGTAGDTAGSMLVSPDLPLDTGVYGFAAQTEVSSGVFGEGPTGVYGFGGVGGYFVGATGLVGDADNRDDGVGLVGHGRIRFPERAKRLRISARKKSVAVTWKGVIATDIAIATINTNRAGRYVQSVVCAKDKVTVTLNGTVSGTTYVSVLVIG